MKPKCVITIFILKELVAYKISSRHYLERFASSPDKLLPLILIDAGLKHLSDFYCPTQMNNFATLSAFSRDESSERRKNLRPNLCRRTNFARRWFNGGCFGVCFWPHINKCRIKYDDKYHLARCVVIYARKKPTRWQIQNKKSHLYVNARRNHYDRLQAWCFPCDTQCARASPTNSLQAIVRLGKTRCFVNRLRYMLRWVWRHFRN